MRESWATTKNRILCSRPFLALHVLMGRPLMYRMPRIVLAETMHVGPHTRLVGCRFDPPGTAIATVEDRAP